MPRKLFFLSLFLIALGGPCLAEGGDKPVGQRADYRLGRGDLIQISVFGVEEFKYSVRIGSSGKITLPYIGEVEAGGQTVAELTDALATAMDGTLFRNPQVSVNVLEYRSNPIVILGSVVKPGSYQMVTGELKLIDALAMAGGLAGGAGDQVFIQRTHEGEQDSQPETITISLDDLFQRGIMSLNIPLRGGDVVNVPPAEKPEEKLYYVIGEVVRPGAFPLPGREQVYLTQAVAAAGGTLKTAKANKGILVRYTEDGQRSELPVDFRKMLEGKKPDILVQARDVIFIPGSNIKTIGYGLLGIIPNVATQTATAGVVP